MKCKLCDINEANKENTHYLSDSIIRSCLNLDGLDGNKNRAKGFYFDLSKANEFVEFNFQQNTSIQKLEEALGREATEEEIKKAYEIPFSVDNVFCSECEDIFTEIEFPFVDKLLGEFRNDDLSEITEFQFKDVKIIRLFFLLQIWRSYICEGVFSIPESVAEKLRKIIRNHKKVNEDELKAFPLSITYLKTTGDQKEYTSNYVGVTNDQNPNLIFMNDFVIQFYSVPKHIQFFDFHGLNSDDSFEEYVNYNEEIFKVRVIGNQKRKTLLTKIIIAEKVRQTMSFYQDAFKKLWCFVFGIYPNQYTMQEYLNLIVGNNEFNVLQYSKENILSITQEFIINKLKIK
jgi:hypothetical protein